MTQENCNDDFSSTESRNIVLLKRFCNEVWNDKNMNTMYEILDPDIVFHYEHGNFYGVDCWKEKLFEQLIRAIPDVQFEIESITAKGDNTIARWTASGTHMGTLYNVSATNKAIQIRGIHWARWNEGSMVEVWSHWDMSYLLRQTQNELKMLRKILPVCSICKRIRNDKGYWDQVDIYLHNYSKVDISHSICPDCLKKHYPAVYKKRVASSSTE
jgi:steroid delta-isomerase-like uncharacterized protein